MEPIIYKHGKLKILNQQRLPADEVYEDVNCIEDAFDAIRTMKVRGAPAIAIVALLSINIELLDIEKILKYGKLCDKSLQSLVTYIKKSCDYLCSSRPTAVNIINESMALLSFIESLVADKVTFKDAVIKIINYIEMLPYNDIKANRSIGDYGAQHIMNHCRENGKNNNLVVLTHCNTGSLATFSYGTAFGVIRSLHEKNLLLLTYCTETRPCNQGSRLTAFELLKNSIEARLICDSMVASLMFNKQIDAVIVGADRIALNGDTANKIGTYQIAVIAHHHHVPFYVAAPLTTIDKNLTDGSKITIEERDENEMKYFGNIQIAPLKTKCWNPAFDITPASLITGGIITDVGVFRPEEINLIKSSITK